MSIFGRWTLDSKGERSRLIQQSNEQMDEAKRRVIRIVIDAVCLIIGKSMAGLLLLSLLNLKVFLPDRH